MDDDLISPIITSNITLGEDSEGNTTVNQYTILRKIGEGSYGKVKLCSFNNRFYAVKVINKANLRKRREIHRNPEGKIIVKNALEDISQEIAIMKKLKHQNIVKLREVIDDEECDKMYMIMVYCHKGSLLEWDDDVQMFVSPWNNNDPIPEVLIRKFFRDMVCGLEYLHYHNIVHRDLKPQNIMLNDNWLVKIADFGQATFFQGSDKLNKSLGTIQFSPPECCGDARQEFSGKAADIWALGLTLYALVYKRLPFPVESILQVFESIQSFNLEFYPPINPELERLLRRLLDKNPDTRAKIFEILQDPWLNRDCNPLSPSRYERIIPTNEEISHAVKPITMVVLAVSVI